MSCLITFEGIEGSGKSTQVQHLRADLVKDGYKVLVTREPGGCPIADAIRRILLDPANHGMAARAELLLYAAARAQHVDEIIRPALKHGQIVLCDRFFDATTAYQGGGRGLDKDFLTAINHQSTGGIVPDLTLLMDLPAEIGLSRARRRNSTQALAAESRFEEEDLSFHSRVRSAYLTLANSENRFQIIDAGQDVDAVTSQVREAVRTYLSKCKQP